MSETLRYRFRAFPVMLLVALLGLSCHRPVKIEPPDGAPPSQATPEKSWDRVFERQAGWTGGDVAASFAVPGDRVVWVFGDSFIGEMENDHRVRSALVNNAIAVHSYDPRDPSRPPDADQVAFFWGPFDESGKPTAWVVPPKTDENHDWYWPTGGGASRCDDRGDCVLDLFLIRLSKTSGAASVWGFEVAGGALAVVDNVEDPAPSWSPRVVEIPSRLRHDCPETGLAVDWGVAVAEGPGAGPAFVFGVVSRADGSKDLVLARASGRRLEDFSRWEFFQGPAWSASPAGISPVAADVSTELSVDRVRDAAAGIQYVMVYSEPRLGDRILVRVADRPEGPWSGPQPVYQVLDVRRSKNYFTYAAKAHAPLSPAGRLLISYIVNSNDFGELAADGFIYRPCFFSIPWRVGK